ncbi:MAG TPA: hypothetical protein VGY32_03515 [Solirubrobacteraceae bacterium]|nr:hypothetical protein [Solirubrobacteraceae bacterium]
MRSPFRHSPRATTHHTAEDSVPEQPMSDLVGSPTPSQTAPQSRHAHRFRIALVSLFAVGLVSLGAALWLSSGGRSGNSGGDWSAFNPSQSGLAGAQEIADFVAPLYRASPANQLAVVTAVNLNNPNNPLQVVVPASSSTSSSASSLLPLPANSTVVYNLCGQGSSDCSIGVGAPSSSRLLLLRREALEMALYSFKYLSGISTVVAILPPGHTVQGCTGICPKPQTTQQTKPVSLALAFDRKELQPWLNHPLRDTLPEDLPPTVSQMPNAPEAELVSVITAHGLFQERSEQGQDGSSVIVLSPMPPQ